MRNLTPSSITKLRKDYKEYDKSIKKIIYGVFVDIGDILNTNDVLTDDKFIKLDCDFMYHGIQFTYDRYEFTERIRIIYEGCDEFKA